MSPPGRPYRVILFTRYPLPGRVKTRLIPSLGADGAATLHRDMTVHMLQCARAWAARDRRSVEVRFDGATVRDMRRWLGNAPRYRRQGPGDLGARMARACEDAFAEEADRVVIIGADCPGLTSATLADAFDALERTDLVLGPALDGGYYLIGLGRTCPGMFSGITWGSDQVLAQTLAAARTLGLRHQLLPPLGDVDRPPDLHLWESARREASTLAVIVPALNEAETFADTLQALAAGNPEDLVVADGGSTDTTREVARKSGARVVLTPPGRGRQMNAAAATISAARLMFIHADTLPPPGYREMVQRTLDRPEVVAGAFSFGLRDPGAGSRLMEWAVAARCRWFHLPYGDQGLFLRRDLFEATGGYPEWPILEDLAMVRRLRAYGRLEILSAKVATSGRRWRTHGWWRTLLSHQLILLGYACGVSPRRLARLRPKSRNHSPPTDQGGTPVR